MDLEPIVVKLLADASQFTRVFDQAQTQLVRTTGTYRAFASELASSFETGMSRAASGIVNSVSRIGQAFGGLAQYSATFTAVTRAFDAATSGISARYNFLRTQNVPFQGRPFTMLEAGLGSVGIPASFGTTLERLYGSASTSGRSALRYLRNDLADTASGVTGIVSDLLNSPAMTGLAGRLSSSFAWTKNLAGSVWSSVSSAVQSVGQSHVGQIGMGIFRDLGSIGVGLGRAAVASPGWTFQLGKDVWWAIGKVFKEVGGPAAVRVASTVGRNLTTAFSAVTSNVIAPVASAIGNVVSSIFSTVTGMFANPLAILGGTAALGAVGAKVVSLAADFEKASIAFEVMTGSAAQGKKVLDDIVQFGIESPFKTSQLIPVAKELKAFGVETDQLLPSLKSIANVAAGTDMPLSRIALAFGQVRVAGRLTGDELRQFVNAGIPINEYVAKIMKVPLQNVRGFIEENKVSLSVFQQAWNMMEEDKFPNMSQRLNDTVSGQWNSLTERIELGMRNLGLAFFKGFDLKGLLNQWSEGFAGLGTKVDNLVPTFQKVREIFDIFVGAGTAVVGVLGDQFGLLVKNLTGNSMNWSDAKEGAKQFVETVVIGFGVIIDQIKAFGRELVNNVLIPLGDLMNKAGMTGQKSVYQTERDKGNSMLWSGLKSFNAWQNEQFLLTVGDDKTKNSIKGLQDAANRNPFQWLKDTMDAFGQNTNVGGDMMARLNKEWDKLNANIGKTTDPLAALGGALGGTAGILKQRTDMNASKIAVTDVLPSEVGELAKKVQKSMEAHGSDPFSHFMESTDKLFSAFRGVPDNFMGPVMPGSGMLTEKQLEFGLAQSFETFQKAVGQAMNHMPPAAAIGSHEAQDTINRSMYDQKSVMEEVRQLMAVGNDMAKAREERLKEIAEAIKLSRTAQIVTKPSTK